MSSNMQSIEATLDAQDIASEQQELLDLVDKLRSAQLDNVKLPQIVVVGDQSAGKSSILEAITGIPFPRAAGACTRFATEIRLRRAKDEKFSVRIVPDKSSRSLEDQQRLLRFGSDVDDSEGFERILRIASDNIAPKNLPGRFAAKDVLVIEKAGPKMPLLTIVDLPGLVKNPNNEQSIDDIRAISDLADRYMKSSRTIILAVVGGNQDYVQAPVLTKARQFDPRGSRTIGVLTKPDLTESIGLEDKFIALVNNQDEPNRFDLGWYVLLNPGPREYGQGWPSLEERKQTETRFFSSSKWSTIPQDRRGALALKQKLSLQLQRHIGRHVRALQREIQKAHSDCSAELKSLGSGKDTVEEMKEELVQLCSDSKDLITPAVHGTYTNPIGHLFFQKNVDLKGTPPHKLRARCVAENRRFAEMIRTHGPKLHFSTGNDPVSSDRSQSQKSSKKDFARDKVEPLVRQNVGTEFPSDHNPRLVYTLFQAFSENWSNLAQMHKDNVGAICNEFLAEVIAYVWPDRMRGALFRELLDPQVREVLNKAQTELTMLLQDLQFEIQPYDPEYGIRLQQWRSSHTGESSYTEAEELLEKMLIHYDLSAKIFVNNVITQVIERHLLQGLLKLFSWVTINKLDERTIVAIAAENQVTRERRLNLKAKKASIEEARDICASLAMRKELRAFDNEDANDSEDSSSEDPRKSSLRAHQNRQSSRRNDRKVDAMEPSSQSQRNQTSEQSRMANYDKTSSFASDLNMRNSSLPQGDYIVNTSRRPEAQPPANNYNYVPPQHAPPTPPRSDGENTGAKVQRQPSSIDFHDYQSAYNPKDYADKLFHDQDHIPGQFPSPSPRAQREQPQLSATPNPQLPPKKPRKIFG